MLIKMSKNDFNLEEELSKIPKPSMFMAGVKHHIEANKIVIKSKKELDKVIDDFGKIGVGGE